MAKRKINLCVTFALCLFLLVGFGSSDQSQNSDSNSNQTSIEALELKMSLILRRLETVEKGKEELEKSHEELKKQFRSSKKKCDEQFKSLRKELEELKSENCVGEDVWLLRPPIRGRRGEKGDSGRNGRAGQKGGRGQNGPKGDQGPIGLTGDRGGTGPQGQRGDKGQDGKPGQKGETVQVQLPSSSPSPSPAGPTTTSETPAPRQRRTSSCSDAMEILSSPRSKKQRIYPHGNGTSLEVLCDFETDGGGWTIIQKRIKGPKEQFKQNWSNYTQGFGSLDGNFWIGLKNIRALTQNGDQELRIQLEDFDGNKKYAKYSSFSISDASDFYKLTLEGFYEDSTIQDSMLRHHNGQKFTTIDKDNDNHPSVNCAVYRGGGGWWFHNCGFSNLNGLYFEKGETVPNVQGILWESWKGYKYSLAKSEMKIRPRK